MFGREKECREKLGKRENFRKNVSSPWSDGCLGLFIGLGANFEAVAVEGPLASKGF